MTRPELEAAIDDRLAPYLPDPGVRQRLVRTLALDEMERTAEQIEKYARPHPWPPRRRHRGPDEGERRPA